ncbi:MAG: hypothetical protein ACRCYA_13300 [Cetobacterium sp.]|uniref:hypothetical protein n=1 Tax=Cetobacterium sp. TaxID=2071632 RepID=UPI003F2A38BD
MKIYLDKYNKTIIAPFEILQKNHIDFIKSCGFTFVETDELKFNAREIRKFNKNKNRKKNRKTNFKKK